MDVIVNGGNGNNKLNSVILFSEKCAQTYARPCSDLFSIFHDDMN